MLIKQVASNVFGLTWAVLDCNEHTTLDDFGSGILVKEDAEDYFGKSGGRLQSEVEWFHNLRCQGLTLQTVFVHVKFTQNARTQDIKVAEAVQSAG